MECIWLQGGHGVYPLDASPVKQLECFYCAATVSSSLMGTFGDSLQLKSMQHIVIRVGYMCIING